MSTFIYLWWFYCALYYASAKLFLTIARRASATQTSQVPRLLHQFSQHGIQVSYQRSSRFTPDCTGSIISQVNFATSRTRQEQSLEIYHLRNDYKWQSRLKQVSFIHCIWRIVCTSAGAWMAYLRVALSVNTNDRTNQEVLMHRTC